MAPRRTQRSQPEHQQSMLALLDEHKYRWSDDLYDDIFQICVGLTNFHIEYNPLREHNAEEYDQREHRMLAIGKEKYRRRKQMRHRMSLNDLPRHHDADEDSDATQI
ncbi:hypothetical protein PRIC1_010424 [Phytophthora ramorum]|uniref:uncharacterized protein n=1 Tax=Phytophthora ramorum TaxID=164328 RepID=UPI0030AA2F68|nr:hypothetical protein KRP23_10853 [Phytophthora ramorum]KAH7498766.1 hypothetical protein KRP22_11906 [Phytophthora ramorum]